MDMRALQIMTEAVAAGMRGEDLGPPVPAEESYPDAWTDEHILKHSTEEQMRSAKAHWWRAPPGPPPEVDPPVRLMMYVSAERMKELKDEASKDLPEGCPFVSTLDALTARIQQVFGNMPLRGSPPPPIRMSQSINVRIGKRLTDPANPDVDLLPSPDVLGNWVHCFPCPPVNVEAMSLGQLAGAFRMQLLNIGPLWHEETRALKKMSAEGDISGALLPGVSPSVQEFVNFTSWQWDASKLSFGGPEPLRQLFFFPGFPLRNAVALNFPMTHEPKGSKAVLFFVSPEVAQQLKQALPL
mmetsp:Transcript_40041/g.119254  ORF Transcript_40041/g.119254 Transcript_40041/m.119254 type:complete len:298 (-) Transcript_40041:954-1847(-)